MYLVVKNINYFLIKYIRLKGFLFKTQLFFKNLFNECYFNKWQNNNMKISLKRNEASLLYDLIDQKEKIFLLPIYY